MQLIYEIIAEEGRFVAGMSRAERAALGFDRTNTLLARHGIQTTETIREEIRELTVLEVALRNDAVATAQLAQRKQQLVAQLGGLQGGMGRTGQSVAQLSFLFNDLQQAQYGWNQALIATSNNVGMIIPMLGGGAGSLAKWLPWVGVAVSALTTGMVLWGSAMKDTAKDAETLAEQSERLAGSMFRIRGELKVIEFENVEAARAHKEELEGQANAIQRQLALRKQIGTTVTSSGLFTAPVFGPALTGEERQEQQNELDRLRGQITVLEKQISDREEAEALGNEFENENKKEYISLLQREREQRDELIKQAAELAGAGAQQLIQLQLQNEALQTQIERTLELERLKQQGFTPTFTRPGAVGGVSPGSRMMEGTVAMLSSNPVTADPRSIAGMQQSIAAERQKYEQATTEAAREAALERIEIMQREMDMMTGVAQVAEETAQRQIASQAAATAAQVKNVADLANAVRQAIKAYLAESVAAMITKAIGSSWHPIAALAAATAGAGAVALLFDKLIPEFGGSGGAGSYAGNSGGYPTYVSGTRTFSQGVGARGSERFGNVIHIPDGGGRLSTQFEEKLDKLDKTMRRVGHALDELSHRGVGFSREAWTQGGHRSAIDHEIYSAD
jgi:hypothetical protein